MSKYFHEKKVIVQYVEKVMHEKSHSIVCRKISCKKKSQYSMSKKSYSMSKKSHSIVCRKFCEKKVIVQYVEKFQKKSHSIVCRKIQYVEKKVIVQYVENHFMSKKKSQYSMSKKKFSMRKKSHSIVCRNFYNKKKVIVQYVEKKVIVQ